MTSSRPRHTAASWMEVPNTDLQISKWERNSRGMFSKIMKLLRTSVELQPVKEPGQVLFVGLVTLTELRTNHPLSGSGASSVNLCFLERNMSCLSCPVSMLYLCSLLLDLSTVSLAL